MRAGRLAAAATRLIRARPGVRIRTVATAPSDDWTQPVVVRGFVSRPEIDGRWLDTLAASDAGVEVERGDYLSERGHVTVPARWLAAYLLQRRAAQLAGDAAALRLLEDAVGGPLYAAQRSDLLRVDGASEFNAFLRQRVQPVVCDAMAGLATPRTPARAGDLVTSVWLGPPGTVTPLHTDPLPNVHLQLVSAGRRGGL